MPVLNETRKIGVGGVQISDKAKMYVNEVLNSGRLSYGKFTKKFEEAFAKEHDVAYCSFLNSGTDALRIGLLAMKRKYHWEREDEVIVPAITFVASANVVLQLGMRPVFVDVDFLTYNLDPTKIENKITGRTRAIMPVHMFGLPCDMGPILEIAKKYHLKIIEDSCETMFGTYNGKKVGSFGDVGAFSTYVAHFLVTGVGGLTTTNDTDLALRIQSLMNHGRDPIYRCIDDDDNLSRERLKQVIERRFSFVDVGYSSRCTEMEAALGLAQLEEKSELIQIRKNIAQFYNTELSKIEGLKIPLNKFTTGHMYMLYPLLMLDRKKDELVYYLETHGIETRPMMPILRSPVYREMYGNIEKYYPVARRINDSGFYIGCHPEIRNSDAVYVVDTIKRFFSKQR